MLLKQVSEKGYVYVLRRSRPEIALITVEYLRALQEAYGDYLDTLEFDKTVGLKRVPLVKYKRQMVGE
jgi:PHD/YefM family antitoxin component YafN of YafNO toxin-antitoxin module